MHNEETMTGGDGMNTLFHPRWRMWLAAGILAAVAIAVVLIVVYSGGGSGGGGVY